MKKVDVIKCYIVICTSVFVTAEDPCTTNSELPRALYRGGQCSIVSGKQTCDRTLTFGWYRAIGLNNKNLEIQTTAASFETCGTKFPYWMNGTHPSVAEQEVNRTVCMTSVISDCDKSLDIKVKNCTGFYVYQLKKTGACPEAYCFGREEPCPPFDPCDGYENDIEDFDKGRSEVCGSISDTCDIYDANRWYRFAAQTSGFLEVSTTCPNVTNACGSTHSIWINGTTALSNGTDQHTACIKDENGCCTSTHTILSKQCKSYMVYNFGSLPSTPCHSICTANDVDDCPVNPTIPSNNSSDTGGNSAVRNGETTMLIYYLYLAALVSILILT